MRKTFPFLILAISVCLIPSLVPAAMSFQADRSAAHNKKGLEYFKEGFYERIPKGQQHEAEQAFDLAMAEFRSAIALKPDHVEAHRNLARLYFVRRQFSDAAESYKNVTRYAPRDVDAYVQAAASYTELQRFDEAVRQLEIARAQTGDPDIVQKLDGYIQKIKNRNQ